jgi:hypothetical protein
MMVDIHTFSQNSRSVGRNCSREAQKRKSGYPASVLHAERQTQQADTNQHIDRVEDGLRHRTLTNNDILLCPIIMLDLFYQ